MATRKDVEQALRRLDARFMKAVAAREAGGLVKAFYADDAVLLPPNHSAVVGRAGIQAYFQGMLDGGLESIRLETVHLEVSGALAWARGRYSVAIAPRGRPLIHDTGKSLVCYRRQRNGGWKAVADMFSSDSPAPA
jgi:ketosteroid isomerase-like protein